MEPSSQNPTIVLEAKETHYESSQSCVEMQSLSSERNQYQQLLEHKGKNNQFECNNNVVSNDDNREIVAEEEDGGIIKCNSCKPLDKSNEDDSGRERLKRHRIEVAGSVWIPDIWGQEELLKDWIDCSAFEAAFVPNRIVSARSALAEEGRRTNTGRLRIENRC